MDILPAQAFWAGLVTYPIGGYLFFMGSRRAIDRAEMRTARALNPIISNERGQAFARQQKGQSPNPNAARQVSEAVVAESDLSIPREVVIKDNGSGGEEGPDFLVESDVSFPQEDGEDEDEEKTSVADQLEKLSKLQQQGLITAEEWAIAKAKLLR